MDTWFNKVFRFSPATNDVGGKAWAGGGLSPGRSQERRQRRHSQQQQRQQQEEVEAFETRAVCDIGEGIAGVAAMTGKKLRVRGCSVREGRAVRLGANGGHNHDRGSVVCWPVRRRPGLGAVTAAPTHPGAAAAVAAAQLEDADCNGAVLSQGGGGGDVDVGDGGGDGEVMSVGESSGSDDSDGNSSCEGGESESDALGPLQLQQQHAAVVAVLQVYFADGEKLSAEAVQVVHDVGRLLSPLLTDALDRGEDQVLRRSAEARLSLSDIVPRDIGLIAMVEQVVAVAQRLTEAERVCLFFVDDAAGELWVAKSVDFDDAKIKIGHGLCGHAAATGGTVNVIDSYEDSRFDSRWDKQTGFVTKRWVCKMCSLVCSCVLRVRSCMIVKGDPHDKKKRGNDTTHVGKANKFCVNDVVGLGFM